MRLPGSARYIVRFDDLCPTANWTVWDELEKALIHREIRPVVGVVPENRDPTLRVGPPDASFWDRVRDWQRRGWTIALHGHEHRYVTNDPGLFGWNARSEFAGLPFDDQLRKLRQAVSVLEREGIRPSVWMAPNHSFDRTTVEALHRVGITTVTDGLALFPYRDGDGTTWVPVQLWSFLPRAFGVWTVCLHVNAWSSDEVAAFVRDLDRYADRIIALPDAIERYAGRRRGLVDAAFTIQRRARKRAAAAMRARPASPGAVRS